MQGATSHDLYLLVSPAAMLGQGLSLNAGASLGLWTPVVDDLKQLGGDLAHAAHNDTDNDDLRYGDNAPAPPPPLLPSPFHFDGKPSVVTYPPTNLKLSYEQGDFYQSGAEVDLQFYSSTTPAASWLDASGRFRSTVPDQAIAQLKGLTGSDGILIDPLFGAPIKFALVDQIYSTKTGQPEPAYVGENDPGKAYWTVWPDGHNSDFYTARVIQIKNWSDSDAFAQQSMVDTMVHEIGHSWNTYNAPHQGNTNTPWILDNQSYFTQFMALSGWSLKPGADPTVPGSWTHTAGKDAFAPGALLPNGDYYSMSNPNEDWAETFKLAAEPIPIVPYSTTLQDKINLIKLFLALTVPSSQQLGAVTDDFVNVYK